MMGRYDEQREAVIRIVCELGSVDYLDLARELDLTVSMANHLLKIFCPEVGEYRHGRCISYSHQCERLSKGGGSDKRE